MHQRSTTRDLSLLGALYVAQSVPLGFFIVALPAIARSLGLGLETVGLLGTLAFPYLLKFLWAPLVDRHGRRSSGHYRTWILPLSLLSIASVLCLLALQPEQIFGGGNHLALLLAVVATAVFMFSAATQDAATDGLAVRLISSERRGWANGVQVGGYYLGQIVGGGLMLVLYALYGWSGALGAMAAMLAMPVVLLWSFSEPPAPADELHRERPGLGAWLTFFKRPGAMLWTMVLLTYRAGEMMALTMLNPMMVDQGRSLAAVGLTVGLLGSAASLGGALLGGVLTQRFGRRATVIGLGFVQALAIASFLLPARSAAWSSTLFAVAVASFCGGAATAALYTWMMDRCDLRSAASDFTVQQSLCAVGPLIAAGASGFSAQALGFSTHFTLSAGVALTSALFVMLFVQARHGAVPEPMAGALPAED